MKKIVFLFCLYGIQFTYGQTVLETNPPDLKWHQVNTPYFKILYPLGFDEQAQRMANTLEHIRLAESKSLGIPPRKISILLQNQSTISNGFVSMFPRRSEFYAMPTQNYNFSGTNDWLNLLAAHEYRHVVQYQHATRGFNKLAFYLFGYPTLSGLAHIGAPDWFWEGDAVVTETALTPGGRGRIPQFGLPFRTNLLEGRKFNYHKQYLRSYKHNIPNHYVLGYHMVSYLRRRTNNPDIWEKITARSWNVPFIPFAFSNAIKKETGLYVTELYNEMARDLTKEWQKEIDTISITPFEVVNKRKTSVYTDYLYPQPQRDGSVLVRKEGIGDIEKYILLKEGKEKKIFTPGYLSESGMLSAPNGIVVWNEHGYDPRWQVRNYSRIKGYDFKSNQRIKFSDKKSRYGSAALSPEGNNVVTVRTDVKYRHRVLVLSLPDGKIEKEFDNPENHFYSMPRWSDDGQKIVILKTTPKGRTITLLNPITGSMEDILPETHENIGHPVLVDNVLLFNSPASGIDNIFAIDMNTKMRYQITSSKYGAYNAAVSPDLNFFYYNEQGRNGMDVVRVPWDRSTWRIFEDTEVEKSYQHLIDQEGRPFLFDSIPQQVYPTKKYSGLTNVINPFSWGAFIQNDLANVDIGISSQNILSTTTISAGYRYDLNEHTGLWRAGVSYQGLYPIIDLVYTQGKRSINEGRAETTIINGSDTRTEVNDIVFKWDERNIVAGLRVPLNLTSSKYSSGLTIGNSIGLTHVSDFRNTFTNNRLFPAEIRNDTVTSFYPFLDYIGNGNLVYNHFNVSAQRMLKRSVRDIQSKWGQAFFLNYYKTPFGGDLEGGLFSAIGYLFFPGLAKHHSLNGYVAYQHTLISEDVRNDYLFRNTVPFPRGQSVSRFENFISTAVNYTLPIWYPDIALGPILNFQRIRLTLFTDYAQGHSAILSGVTRSYHSVGAELKMDFNVMRFLPQFDLGVRYSYGISPSFANFELIIGTFQL